jgi:VanZ family protein
VEYLRPRYGRLQYFDILIGSLPNFVGAFVFSLALSSEISKLYVKKRKLIIYLMSSLVFIILTIEEFHPFFTATKTFDKFDIIASAIGALCSVIVLESSMRKKYENKNK